MRQCVYSVLRSHQVAQKISEEVIFNTPWTTHPKQAGVEIQSTKQT